MEETKISAANKIRILRAQKEGCGEKWIEDLDEIKKLVDLVEQIKRKVEKTEMFINNPDDVRFRIDFYKGKTKFWSIGVCRSYIRKDDGWHWSYFTSLNKVLMEATEDVQLIKMEASWEEVKKGR